MRFSGLAARLTKLRSRIALHLPVPLAAPESAGLAAARRRVIVALLALGLTCLGADRLCGLSLLLAATLVAVLLTFLAIQTPLWLRAKSRADNAWLMRETKKDEGDD